MSAAEQENVEKIGDEARKALTTSIASSLIIKISLGASLKNIWPLLFYL